MTWARAALAVAVVALWLRTVTLRRRLDRLDEATGLWRVAEPADVWAAEMRERWVA